MLFLAPPTNPSRNVSPFTKYCNHKKAMLHLAILGIRERVMSMAESLENMASGSRSSSNGNGSNDSGNRLVWIIVGTAAGLIGLGVTNFTTKLDRIDSQLHTLTVDITKELASVKAKTDTLDKITEGTTKEQMARTAKFGELEAAIKMLSRNQEFTDSTIKALTESMNELRKDLRSTKSNTP